MGLSCLLRRATLMQEGVSRTPPGRLCMLLIVCQAQPLRGNKPSCT